VAAGSAQKSAAIGTATPFLTRRGRSR